MNKEEISMTETNKPAAPPIPWDDNIHQMLLSAPHTFRPGASGLTEETLPLLLKETEGIFHLVPDQPVQKLAERADQEAVGTGKAICSMCKGTGRVRRLHIGKQSGVQVLKPAPCYCTVYRKYFSFWLNAEYVAADFRDCTMINFRNGKLRDRFKQVGGGNKGYETIRTAVRQFPNYCILMVGSHGSGKTTLMSVLYDHALRNWASRSFEHNLVDPAVWKITALRLAAEQRDWEMKDSQAEDATVKKPMVTADKILTALNSHNQFVPHIAIDEFDKYKMLSDFQNNHFHQVIDMCQSNGGQVVCNSNLSVAELRLKIGPQHADGIIRRLIGGPRGMLIDFDKGEVHVNKVRHILKDGVLVPTDGKEFDLKPMKSGETRVSRSEPRPAPAKKTQNSALNAIGRRQHGFNNTREQD